MSLDRNDIQEWHTANQQIAIVWCIEDVQEVRSDLNDSEAWKVLEHCKKYHDACIGINWETLDVVAHILFPED